MASPPPTAATGSRPECVKVAVRCRPLSDREPPPGDPPVRGAVLCDPAAATVTVLSPAPPKASASGAAEAPKLFTFDAVFGAASTQSELYDSCARSIVDGVLDGFNGTVMAYGQTGTGKTFAMEGDPTDEEKKGIAPRAFDHIFARIASSPAGSRYLVRASYLEIYNEDIRDLLQPKQQNKLEIREVRPRDAQPKDDARPEVYVRGLTSVVVKDAVEIAKLAAIGAKNRAVAGTAMNERSSRSHCIFTVTVERSESASGSGEPQESADQVIRVGKLHLVDLAGSERQDKTHATGDRLREANKINLSLSVLGNVIAALVEGGRAGHVPYRDSKLTRLLQDSLGGNSRTLMLATVGPSPMNLEETLSTLRYANRAKNIRNRPHVNQDPKDALIREFQEEIQRLKMQLEAVESGQAPIGEDGGHAHPAAAGEPGDVPASDFAGRQAEIDASRAAVMQSTTKTQDEKDALLRELDARARELDAERAERGALAEKLRDMEAKLLVGGVSILDRHQEQQQQLARHTAELEERKMRERQMRRELEERAEQTIQIEGSYASLQEEAAAKTKKLKQLWAVLTRQKQEIRNVQELFSREREDLLEVVRSLARELKLKMLVLDACMPEEELSFLEQNAVWREDLGVWTFKGIDLGDQSSSKRGSSKTASGSGRTNRRNASPESQSPSKAEKETPEPPQAEQQDGGYEKLFENVYLSAAKLTKGEASSAQNPRQLTATA
ncbi:P-loop containing nucleoside triphosphate hydrolase protein [Hyaloraphidium curvatum]|nr:P-loop containing nucleoside triphosphate hydrolase protein [Hyaloraphidium curvatum]